MLGGDSQHTHTKHHPPGGWKGEFFSSPLERATRKSLSQPKLSVKKSRLILIDAETREKESKLNDYSPALPPVLHVLWRGGSGRGQKS